MSEDSILSLSLDTTLFFPVSGNPAGLNHFSAAELLLRQNPAWKQVVFILSNGRHPDPTKADALPPPELRLEMLAASLAEIQDDGHSQLARLAGRGGETLRCGPAAAAVWTREFAFPRPVPTAETVAALREAHPAHAGRIHWFAGSDLVARMADPAIFSGDDLTFLAEHCQYAILERQGHPPEAALRALAEARGVSLAHTVYRTEDAPAWLKPFLALSSTHIRNAAEAGDPLGAMLTAGAAELVRRHGLYRHGPPAARAAGEAEPEGRPGGGRSPLQLAVAELREQAEGEAAAIADVLTRRAGEKQPHSLAVAEATVGGLLTAAFAGRSGASVFFRQARFVYDHTAKLSLIGAENEKLPAVSEAMAVALAQAIRREAGSDFGLAETGMAGPPDGRRRSMKNGLCHLALAGPGGVTTDSVQLNPFLTRREHQLGFALHALKRMKEWLGEEGG